MNCDLDTSVPDWIIDYPETSEIFSALGMEVCCGGKSLEYVCREQGYDPQEVVRKLKARIACSPDNDE